MEFAAIDFKTTGYENGENGGTNDALTSTGYIRYNMRHYRKEEQ